MPKDTIKLCNEALEHRADIPKAHFLLYKAFRAHNMDLDKAKEHLEKAIKLAPQD